MDEERNLTEENNLDEKRMLNEEAWTYLDEAMFTSSLISKKEREKGEVDDINDIYPRTKAETEHMDEMLNRAEEVVEHPGDRDYVERYNMLREIVDWSKKRHSTWMWSLICGALLGAGIFYYFKKDQEDDILRARVEREQVQQWKTVKVGQTDYDKCPSQHANDAYSLRLTSADKYKMYKLIEEGDHIAVCISGGKDSMLMAKLFQEIKRHRQVEFELTFLVMDPGYNEENRELIENNAGTLGIPITIFESTIFDAVDTIEKSPCYICARMRRGYLYSKAKELGCNKIALGHHYDDVIETILMGMLHGAQIQTMMPKLHSTNFEGMELIRPMYLIRETDICAWRDHNDLHFLQCACHFTDTCTSCHEDGTTASKRLEIKKLIAELKKGNPYIESNIFNSVENVNLNTVISYKKDGIRHNFLEDY